MAQLNSDGQVEPNTSAGPAEHSGRAGWSPVTFVALGAILVLALPVLRYGPWLPFIDLVSFVGMDAYPPQLSYGPLHYYTFQFTYEGHAVLSRLFTDLQIPPRYHIVLFYALEVAVCFGVVWRSLERLVKHPFWRSVGIALGTLAFWDGCFLWGGPLAYSLAGSAVTLATFLAMREAAEPERASGVLIALLLAFAVFCHPFAVPFALIVCALRFWFVPRRRWQTAALTLGVTVFAFVILKDSPPEEASASGLLKLLFGFSTTQIGNRLSGLFHQDDLFASTLFGATPWACAGLFFVMAVVHVCGWLVSPYIALRARGAVWLRMLATLNTVVAVLYLFSWDLPTAPIPEWPQRILTLYAPFTYLAGFAGLVYLGERRFPLRAGGRIRGAAWLIPAVLLAFMVAVQVPVFRLGPQLETNVRKVRQDILRSGISDAYVVVAGIDNIRPFYLRCVPFMLFCDPELIARHLLVATEWHFQARHPSRLEETWFNLGRKRYLAAFSCENATLGVRLIEQPTNRFPVIEGTNLLRWGNAPQLAMDHFKQGLELFKGGFYAAAFEHFNTAIYLRPQFADAWNDGGAALFRVGQRTDAISYFRNALQRDPKLIDAHVNLAVALAEDGKTKEAAAEANEVLRLKPGEPRARTLLQQLAAAAATPPAK